MKEQNDFCLVYDCPLDDVDPELLHVCEQLGDTCDSCADRFS